MVLREQGHFRKWLFTVSHLPRRSLRYSRTKTRPPEPTKVAIGHVSPRVTAWRLSAPERPPRPAQMGRGGIGGPMARAIAGCTFVAQPEDQKTDLAAIALVAGFALTTKCGLS